MGSRPVTPRPRWPRPRVRVRATYTAAYLAHVPLETRAAVAEWQDGRLTVWTGTNVPFAVRAQLSATLGISEEAIRVIVPPVGGGFGGKHGDEAIEAARLARAIGAGNGALEPGRGIPAGLPAPHGGDRHPGRPGRLRLAHRVGLPRHQRRGQRDRLPVRGAQPPAALPAGRFPAAQGPYRALSATANTFARESHIDALAYAAGADPLRFRLRHLEDQQLAAVLEAVTARFGWRPGWQPAAARPGGAGRGPGAARAWRSAWRRAAGWRPAPRR